MNTRVGAMAGITALLILSLAPAAVALPYTAEYVFGDSLSDNGNLAEALVANGTTKGNFPNPPSYHDSFTNGPVAVQLLANSLGLTLDPSLFLTGFRDVGNLFGPNFTPGTNYAVAGAKATSAPGPGIDLGQQVGAFGVRTGGAADPAALYVVMIGGNDVRNAATLAGTGAQDAAVTTGVQTELAAIQALAGYGARNFFVVNVPDVGAIPESKARGDSAAATRLSQEYDNLLASGIGKLSLFGSSLTQFDLYGFNANILANAASYGLTNTVDPCYTNTPFSAATTPQCGPNAQNIGSFAYWDAIHPTATVQALWASGFEAALEVPEPSSAGLVAAGLMMIFGLGWTRRPAVRGSRAG